MKCDKIYCLVYCTARKLPKSDSGAAAQARPRGVDLTEQSEQSSSQSGCCKSS